MEEWREERRMSTNGRWAEGEKGRSVLFFLRGRERGGRIRQAEGDEPLCLSQVGSLAGKGHV